MNRVLSLISVFCLMQTTAAQMPHTGLSTCPSQSCGGLTFVASPDTTSLGLVEFDVDAQDDLSQAYANQVIGLVSSNLEYLADVLPPVLGLDAFGNSRPGSEPLSVLADEQDPAGAISGDPVFSFLISGSIEQDQQEVFELRLEVQSRGGLSVSNLHPLTIRASVTDWDRVGHYMSDLIFENFNIERGLFQSQILFVVEESDKQRLALINQSGEGFQWVEAAGQSVEFATFLDTRFDLAYLDSSNNQNSLMYHNLLTGRSALLVRLPDLIGHPDIGAGGRFIAFATVEDGVQNTENPLTDMILVDVEAAKIQLIERLGTDEKDPSFSPDLSSLAMVSSQNGISELLIYRMQGPLDQRDRTKDQSPLENWNPQLSSYYRGAYDLRDPSWSADGTAIAFIQEDGEEDHLMILDVETNQIKRVASGHALRSPTWSPHPDFLAFIAQPVGQEEDALLRFDRGRGAVRVLQTPQLPMAPAWSPPQP